jgi:rRNA maturation endonuclease Nob1
MVYLRSRNEIKKFGGTGGIMGLFGSFSSSGSGDQTRTLKYYCMSCGKEHNEIACPKCGSKMKRVG